MKISNSEILDSSLTSKFVYRLPSYVGFGVAAGAFAVYFTSGWVGKNLMQFVPFYNKKYDEKDPEMA